jgi:hypothetical protein
MISDKARFAAAINKFEEINSEDPNTEIEEGKAYPKEVLYARRMAACLNEIAPEASEALQLAVRCQHIRRWAISRQDFPLGIDGYNKWRNSLKKYHAQLAGEILTEVDYPAEIIQRVQFLVQKRQLKIDPEVQLLEDVICLVFLKYYFLPFAQQHPEEKVLDIVQKTWQKMTPAGQQLTLRLALPESAQLLIAKALAI